MATEKEVAAAKAAYMEITGNSADEAEKVVPLITVLLDAAELARAGRFGIKPDTGVYTGLFTAFQ